MELSTIFCNVDAIWLIGLVAAAASSLIHLVCLAAVYTIVKHSHTQDSRRLAATRKSRAKKPAKKVAQVANESAASGFEAQILRMAAAKAARNTRNTRVL
jgi:hypothetical protein